MIIHARPMELSGGEEIIRHPATGEPVQWRVTDLPVRHGEIAEIPINEPRSTRWVSVGIHQELTITTTHRQDTIAGLRQLADFLDAHPDVPVSGEQVVSYWTPASLRRVEARTQVDKIAAELGVTAGPRAVLRSATHAARRRFGPVVYEAAAVGVYPGRVR